MRAATGHDSWGVDESIGPRPSVPAAAEFLRTVRRQIRLFIGVAVVIAAGVAAVTFLLPHLYTARATVYVRPETPDPLLPAASGQAGLTDGETATVADLLRGRDVVANVVGEPAFAAFKEPESPAHRLLCAVRPSLSRCHNVALPTLNERVDGFLARLTVTPGERSRVIELSYADRNPARAAAALNALVEFYQAQQIASRSADLRRTYAWLSRRAAELRDHWMAAEARVGTFRADHGLAAGNASADGQTLVGQQITHAAGDLATAESDLAAAQSRQTAMRRAGSAFAAGDAARDPTLAALAGALAELQVRSASLHAAFGPEHPSVVAIDGQVAAARASLGAEMGRARASIDSDVSAAQAEVSTLRGNLDQLGQRARGLSGSQVSLAALTNEAADARTSYEAFLSREKQLDDRSDLLEAQVQFASHAAVPSAPSFPDVPRFLAGGVALGLLGALGIVLAREHLRTGFSNISRVGEALSTPMLATVPKVPGRTGDIPGYLAAHPYSAAAESIRSLAASLYGQGPDGEAPQSLVIASATGGEGKTTIAIWLATVLAASGQRVLLIDADHRRGAVAARLGGARGPGFAELISGAADDPYLLVRTPESSGFHYIGAGATMSQALGQRELRRLRGALERFRDSYDMVIIDTPPLLAMTDALLCARAADASVFVCRWNSTGRQAVATSLARFERAGAPVLGVVLSMLDQSRLALFSDEYEARDVKLIEGYYSNA
jgi:capsular exopolysaccharide synthesis family protein